MSERSKKGKGGRTLKKIPWAKVDKWLEAGCLGTEVAARIGIHKETLYRRCQKEKGISFSDYIQQKKAAGNSILREEQFKAAMKGDRGMLIWLGKQRLDQRDSKDLNHGGRIELPNFQDAEWLPAEKLKELREQNDENPGG